MKVYVVINKGIDWESFEGVLSSMEKAKEYIADIKWNSFIVKECACDELLRQIEEVPIN